MLKIAILCMKQWQAVIFPLSLTSLMYAGSFILKSLSLLHSWSDYVNAGGGISFGCIKRVPQSICDWVFITASNVMAWRNFVVVSIYFRFFFTIELWCYLNISLRNGYAKVATFACCRTQVDA